MCSCVCVCAGNFARVLLKAPTAINNKQLQCQQVAKIFEIWLLLLLLCFALYVSVLQRAVDAAAKCCSAVIILLYFRWTFVVWARSRTLSQWRGIPCILANHLQFYRFSNIFGIFAAFYLFWMHLLIFSFHCFCFRFCFCFCFYLGLRFCSSTCPSTTTIFICFIYENNAYNGMCVHV